MQARSYHDFEIYTDPADLRLDETGRILEFSVLVYNCPAGQAEKKERVCPPAGLDLGQKVTELEGRGLDKDEEAQVELGIALADLLLPPYARSLLQRSLAAIPDEDGLRLRLRLAPQLAALPWEMMYLDEPGACCGFLALDPVISIVRFEALAVNVDWFPPQVKYRVGILMASPGPYTTYPWLNLPDEQKLIFQELGKNAGIDPLYRPRYTGLYLPDQPFPGATLEDLNALLAEDLHILHFSGHGETRQDASGIYLAAPQNQALFLRAEALAEKLNKKGLRVVILNACQTGTFLQNKHWSSLPSALMKTGIPAVIAMQFRIRQKYASAFADAFYNALVSDCWIDEAVAKGRQAIRDLRFSEEGSPRDWAAPVLYLRTSNGRVLQPMQNEQARQQAILITSARDRQYQAWWDWLERGVPPSREQIARLEQSGDSHELTPPQAFLLLRAAVALDLPIEPWYGVLRHEEGQAWLERVDRAENTERSSLPADARRLVGQGDPSLPARPASVGPLAWAAVSHPDLVTRHSAAIALTAIEELPEPAAGLLEGQKSSSTGLKRLEAALGRLPASSNPRARQVELRALLADADPRVAADNRKLPFTSQVSIWWWRARRRIILGLPRQAGLVLGGAFGAGLGLGLFRFCAALVDPSLLAGWLLVSNFLWGFLMCGALLLGMTLAGPLLLAGNPSLPEPEPELHAQEKLRRKVRWAAIGLGTLAFALANALVAILLGVLQGPNLPLLPLGLLAGLGLSLAMSGQPAAGWRLGGRGWLVRLLAGALGLCVTQLAVFAQGRSMLADPIRATSSTVLIQCCSQINSAFSRYPFFYELFQRPGALDAAACLDAILAGMVLVVGMTAGLHLATRLMSTWRSWTARVDFGEG